MPNKDVFITLEQFKALASRIQAKENYLRESLEKLLLNDTLDSTQCSLRLRDKLFTLYEDMKRPADCFLGGYEMSNPSRPAPSQLDLFGEEFC